jgi:flagellar hook assembly protein FlgD
MSFGIEVPYKLRVRLAVYDVLGRRIRTLLDDEVPAGERIVHWDGTGADGVAVGSGLYFARATSASGQRAARVVLIR